MGGSAGHDAPRILVATNDFPPRVGGVERFLFDLVDHLSPDRIHVLAPAHDGSEQFDRGVGFTVERLPLARLGRIAPWRVRLEALWSGGGFDVVLVGQALPLGLLGARLAELGAPHAVMTHGVESWMARVPGTATLLRRATANAGLVFAISRSTGRAIRRAVPRHVPMALLSPGVDTRRFRPDVDGSSVRERLGVGSRPLVLCVSRMVPRKGFDVLVRAAPRIREAVPDAAFVFVGDGPDRERIDRLVAASPASDAILLMGAARDDELPAFHAAADVFAMPCRSRWGGLEEEGFGIVFMEAAASRKPVVAGDSGGVAEAVVDGETGIVVDGTSTENVADAIIELLTDRARAERMGAEGRRRAERDYDWDVIADRLVGHLRTIARSAP